MRYIAALQWQHFTSRYQGLLSMAGDTAVHVQDSLLIDWAAHSIILEAHYRPYFGTLPIFMAACAAVRLRSHGETSGGLRCDFEHREV